MVATLASTFIEGGVSAIQLGNPGCENECNYLAVGWPFPYIVDGPGVSPVGTVSIFGALIGVDTLFITAMVKTFVVWLLLVAGAAWAISHRRN